MGQVIHLDDDDDDDDDRARKDWEDMLDDLLDIDSGLSSRAVDFIDDLDKHWRGRDLTEKQQDWLRALHNERC